jgi:thiamine-phosphate pyrophosphorylase
MTDCQNGNNLPVTGNRTDGQRDLAVSHRILDANFNRASEGYRVAEEYARFVLDDSFLTRSLKDSRHSLTQIFQGTIGEAARLAFRETQSDVGATISTEGESIRSSPVDVARASFKRVEQALRSLEEYGKIISAKFARHCEALRYEIYTLEKAVVGVREQAVRLPRARVYVLMDGRADVGSFERHANEIAQSADLIQLREKKLPDSVLLDRAKRLRRITSGTNCLFIMNDRPDLAVLSQADGVHLGQDELSVSQARQIVGEKLLIGVSTHNIDQLRKAVLDGASYVGCGPVFASKTKSFEEFAGLDFLSAAAKETSLPCFAIGGINASNVALVGAAGFTRVAIQGALENQTSSPRDLILEMKKLLGVGSETTL